jgi:hypothetical protein
MPFCLENVNPMNALNINMIKLYLITLILPLCSSAYFFAYSAVKLLFSAFEAFFIPLPFVNRCQYALVNTPNNTYP